MRNTKEAFIWIISLLQRKNIPFHISGGFAANIYGSKRELADIDIDIPEESFSAILPDIENFIIYGPQQYFDDSWDLKLITLEYLGQEIDIAGAHQTKVFNKNTNDWELLSTDFERDIQKEVFGITVPVMCREDLIDYKSKLQRDVDIIDIRVIS